LQKTATKVLRARAYVRVSHVGKGREASLLSDSMQMDEARRYAGYMGFSFDEESSRTNKDLDVSGFRKAWRQRPGLMAHYRAAERGEFDVLVFYKISRLARNVKEALDMIEAFEKLGVSFHFVVEKIDSTSGHGRFVRNVLLSAAEMQSEDTSDFLKAACERRAREGKLQGGSLPCWIQRRDNGDLEENPVMVRAMRRMVELRMQGNGYVKIAQRLNAEGHRTVKGKFWTDGMTYKYLQPTYVQTMLGTGFFRRNSPHPIEIPEAFPPILSHEEVDSLLTVQRLYSEDYGRKPVGELDWMVNKRRKKGRYSASSIHLLSSLVFCPYCGARMVASSRSDTENRSSPFKYGCPRYLTRPDVHRRYLSSISATGLEDAVLRVVRGVLTMPPKEMAQPVETQQPESGIERLQAKIDKLVKLHLDGRLEDVDFTRQYAELVAEKERVLSSALNEDVVRHRVAAELSAKSELTREELRQLVLLVVERVEAPVVIEGETIRPGNANLRRFAKVVLSFSCQLDRREYLSPVHTAKYTGERSYQSVQSSL